MNKLLKIVLGVIIIVSATIIVHYGFRYNDYRYQIYFSHHNGFSVNKTLGIIPFSYLEDYDEEILEGAYPYSLINVIDLRAPIYCNDIIFYNREEKKRKILKGYPLSLVESTNYNEQELLNGQYIAEQINIEVFNEYISLIEKFGTNLKREDLVIKFATLLSNPNDSTLFKRIKKKSDLTSILIKTPKVEGINTMHKEEDFIDIQNFEIQNQGNEFIFWYHSSGLVKFQFEFDQKSNKILKVKSEILGLLGNEYETIC